MRFPAALRRLLLCVVLVLNGPGTAVAAMQIHAVGAPAAATMAAAMAAGEGGATAGAQADCHRGHGPMAAPGAAGNAGVHAATSASEPSGDRCTAGGCQCTCLQQAPLLAAGTRIPGPAALSRPSLHPLLAGHPAPALAHPLRPPIGRPHGA